MGLHRCTEPECPHVGQQTSRSCRCHKTNEEVLTAQRDRLLDALKTIAGLTIGRGDGVVGDYAEDVREVANTAIDEVKK